MTWQGAQRNLAKSEKNMAVRSRPRLAAVQEDGPVPSMNVVSSPCPGYVVVAVGGDLDLGSAAWLAGSLTAVTAAGALVILDLAELAFIDCSAARTLASARRQALQAGGDLMLADPQWPVRRVLSLIDLTGLPVFASVTEAASGYHAAPDARLAS